MEYDPMVSRLLIGVVGILSVVGCAFMFKKRNRSVVVGTLLGFVLGPIGLIIALCVPVKKTDGMVTKK